MVSRGGGRNPIWHRNSRELFYLSANGRAMMSARLDLDKGRFESPVKLFDIPDTIFTWSGVSARYYDVSADGQRFLMLQTIVDPTDRGVRPDVVLVENWFEELRSR
jgi:hypothetical protein